MRIIAGEFRSRRLVAPRDASTTRPIPDRVKESLFGLLRASCDGVAAVDLFSGTGPIGLEAISRGAASCMFVERDRAVADLLERNIADLGVADRCDVVRGDALGQAVVARAPRPLGLVFMDPPYGLVTDPAVWPRVRDQLARFISLLSDDGFAVLRTPWPFEHAAVPPPAPGPTPVRQPEPAPGRPQAAARGIRRGSPRPERWDHRAFSDGSDPAGVRAGRRARAPGREIADDPEPAPEAPAVEGSRTPPVPVDLGIRSAVGPETHVYHATAVHLYMRRREQPADAPLGNTPSP